MAGAVIPVSEAGLEIQSLVTLEAASGVSHLPGLGWASRHWALSPLCSRPTIKKNHKFQQKSQSAPLLHSCSLSPGARDIHGNASQAKSHIHCLLTGNFISKAVISENTYPSFLGRAAVGFAGSRAGTAERLVTSRRWLGTTGHRQR